jgi:hypothetical protein
LAKSAKKPAKQRRPWRSTVARHPERLSIELARLAGMSLDRVSAKHGVKRDAIARHMASLSEDYKAALALNVPLEQLVEKASAEGQSLLDCFAVINSVTMQQLISAAASGDRHAVANLSRAAIEGLRERGKLTGEILQTPTIQNVTNNAVVFMASPFMAQLQTMLLARLQPYPDALRAVLSGLEELEGASTSTEPPPEMPPTAFPAALLEAPRAAAA